MHNPLSGSFAGPIALAPIGVVSEGCGLTASIMQSADHRSIAGLVRRQHSAIGSHHNLDAAILFVAKPFIGLRTVFKAQAVGD